MNAFNLNDKTVSTPAGFVNRCNASCRKLVAGIRRAKDALVTEFRGRAGHDEQMLRLALNEAEALAWQTEFPFLVFPTLAREKAESVAAWSRRQRFLLEAGPGRLAA